MAGDANELGKVSMMLGIAAGYYFGVNWHKIKIRFRKVWSGKIVLNYFNLKELVNK